MRGKRFNGLKRFFLFLRIGGRVWRYQEVRRLRLVRESVESARVWYEGLSKRERSELEREFNEPYTPPFRTPFNQYH